MGPKDPVGTQGTIRAPRCTTLHHQAPTCGEFLLGFQASGTSFLEVHLKALELSSHVGAPLVSPVDCGSMKDP